MIKERETEELRESEETGRWMGTPPRPASSLPAQTSDKQLRRKSSIISSGHVREDDRFSFC